MIKSNFFKYTSNLKIIIWKPNEVRVYNVVILHTLVYFTTYLGSTENILRLDFIIPRGVGILFKETMHKTILLKLFYY